MPQVLKLAHLINEHGMPEMKIGSGRVESRFDAQRLASLKLSDQLRFDEHLISAPFDHRQLLFNRLHGKPRTIIKGRQPYKIDGRLQAARLYRPAAQQPQGLPPMRFAYILDSYFPCKNMPEAQ